MKYFLSITIIFFTLLSSVSAGLFEYYLGEEVQKNSTTDNAGVVENLNTHPNAVNSYPSRNFQSEKSYYTYSRNYDRYDTDEIFYANSIYDPRTGWDFPVYRVSRPYYDRNVYERSGYYHCDDIEDALDDELERLVDEAEYIDELIDEAKRELRRVERRSGSYWNDIEDDIENDIKRLERREDFINDLRRDIRDELRDAKKDCGRSSSRYYYNYYGNNYYDLRYDYSRHYYGNRNYSDTRYNGYSESYYDYDKNLDYDDYRYIPNYVNPRLQDVREGRIYIK